MSKTRFNYWKWTALCAVLAMVAALSLSTSRASGPTTTTVSGDPDLSSELRTLDSFEDDILKFNKRVREQRAKGALTAEEFAALRRDADGLKARASSVQSAIRSAINKLKAAGLWDTLDDTTLAQFGDEKVKGVFRKDGGARRILEDVASQLSSKVPEFLMPIEDLQPGKGTVRSDSVENTADPGSFRCKLSGVRLKFSHIVHGGQPSQAANNAFTCHCIESLACD